MTIFIEENGKYALDASEAEWATDCIHEQFQQAKTNLSDVDFVVETAQKLLLVEYKNALIEGCAHPEAFKPGEGKKIHSVVKKYYDSLHYLTLMGKDKPKEYIYILEYPNGDSVSRRLIRNKLKDMLPFGLQAAFANNVRQIDKVEVLSINEWNENEEYGLYPIVPVNGGRHRVGEQIGGRD